MMTYAFEFKCGNNLTFKLFLDRRDAYAYGTKINADLMREIDNLWPHDWETPKELVRMYNEYKLEQR
jgi:hypothetical protein